MLKRSFLTLLSFIISFFVLLEVFSELAILFEMWSTGAQHRSELADDFGLGILLMLVTLPLTLLRSLVVAFITWRKARRFVK